jgi:hypothetical protein
VPPYAAGPQNTHEDLRWAEDDAEDHVMRTKVARGWLGGQPLPPSPPCDDQAAAEAAPPSLSASPISVCSHHSYRSHTPSPAAERPHQVRCSPPPSTPPPPHRSVLGRVGPRGRRVRRARLWAGLLGSFLWYRPGSASAGFG